MSDWRPGGTTGAGLGGGTTPWPADRRPFADAVWSDPSTWNVPLRSVQWFCFLFFLHAFAALAIRLSRNYGIKRGDALVAAVELPSLAGALFLGAFGVMTQWRLLAQPMADPLHGNDEGSRVLGEVMLGLQSYTFCASLVVSGLRKPAMVIHHAVSALLAHQSLLPYLHGYAPFYLGCVEMSNWPLCFVDFMRALPDLQEKFPGAYQGLRFTFAILFVPLRLILWTLLALVFWYDSVALLSSGRQRSTFAVACFLVCNIVMTGLQWVWGRLVLRGIYEAIYPDAKRRRKGDKQPAPTPVQMSPRPASPLGPS
eukprot:TRINITY_DN60342_c0_g1_i1.p1 TRINITY_DN60342_c0_g1~~TRINITY_DN60342_c0_g1_i1.p1  ORF type:complete len:312 (+),score=86.77 TRINITY_DN60342_c0_g1_i1:83-1018(+)